jgi:hypothetical protein
LDEKSLDVHLATQQALTRIAVTHESDDLSSGVRKAVYQYMFAHLREERADWRTERLVLDAMAELDDQTVPAASCDLSFVTQVPAQVSLGFHERDSQNGSEEESDTPAEPDGDESADHGA